jgi:hypothetical protein
MQKANTTGNVGRVFSTNHVTPGRSFAAAVRQNVQPQQATTITMDAGSQNTMQQATTKEGQSVQASTVNTASVNNLLTVATVVQQNMTGFNDDASEEGKIVTITKIVLKLLNRNGC